MVSVWYGKVVVREELVEEGLVMLRERIDGWIFLLNGLVFGFLVYLLWLLIVIISFVVYLIVLDY